jgi:hypothetical protein
LHDRLVIPKHVPKGTEVVWTLTHPGRTYSVPGRATSIAYEMSWSPAAFGSLHPAVRFTPDGPESRGPEGIVAERVTTSVGVPVTLSAVVQVRGVREGYDVAKTVVPVSDTWILHQGPAAVSFEPERSRIEGEGWACRRPGRHSLSRAST